MFNSGAWRSLLWNSGSKVSLRIIKSPPKKLFVGKKPTTHNLIKTWSMLKPRAGQILTVFLQRIARYWGTRWLFWSERVTDRKKGLLGIKLTVKPWWTGKEADSEGVLGWLLWVLGAVGAYRWKPALPTGSENGNLQPPVLRTEPGWLYPNHVFPGPLPGMGSEWTCDPFWPVDKGRSVSRVSEKASSLLKMAFFPWR